MEGLFIKLLNMSISAGWLILAVIAARLLLKKAPRWISVWLWGLVALRLILPFSIESGFSLLPSAQTISPSIVYAEHPAVNSGIQLLDGLVNPTLAVWVDTNPTASVNPVQIWLAVGSAVWLVGMTVLLLYSLLSFLKLRQKVKEAVPEYDNIWLGDQVMTPFILGVFCPRIYLPSGLDAEEMGYVLAHEQAHLKRRDHLWKPMGFLLLSVHWFNPLVWIAYLLLCRDIEMACDEKVIRDMELPDKKAYASALVSCSMQRKLVLACPLAFGELGVKERVKGVLNYKKPAFWAVAAAIMACVAVAVCFLTNPKQGEHNASVAEAYEGDGYIGILWEGRRYVPFCSVPNSRRGALLGHVGDDPKDQLYEYKGYSTDEWIISFYHSGLMDASMLMREVKVTDFPDGLESEYEWNHILTVSSIQLDYGTSSLYSQEDMDSAIQLILLKFSNDFDGCELHSIRYASDACSSRENLAWMNDLGKNSSLSFTQCIEFLSDFHTPADPSRVMVWAPDEEYVNWQWWLARTDGGEWHLMTWGY